MLPRWLRPNQQFKVDFEGPVSRLGLLYLWLVVLLIPTAFVAIAVAPLLGFGEQSSANDNALVSIVLNNSIAQFAFSLAMGSLGGFWNNTPYSLAHAATARKSLLEAEPELVSYLGEFRSHIEDALPKRYHSWSKFMLSFFLALPNTGIIIFQLVDGYKKAADDEGGG
jgi:hypothetical protein